jgi:nicotinamidase-related amidase
MIDVPAQPYAFTLDPARTALVVIDMQRDFVEHGGFGEALGNDVTRLQAIIPAVADIIALFRAKNWPILHTRECHLPDLSDCPPAKRLRGKGEGLRIGDAGPMGRLLVRGEPGAAIIAECAPLADEMVIDKPGKGMFCNTACEDMLRARGVTHLVFTGVTTEVCVQTSMREANDRGFECLLLTDCTESYFAEYKAAVISMVVAQGGIVGWATDLASLKGALT